MTKNLFTDFEKGDKVRLVVDAVIGYAWVPDDGHGGYIDTLEGSTIYESDVVEVERTSRYAWGDFPIGAVVAYRKNDKECTLLEHGYLWDGKYFEWEPEATITKENWDLVRMIGEEQ